MKIKQSLIIFSIFILSPLTLAFNCSSTVDHDYCKLMDGCSWEKDKCAGDFKPNCPEDPCFFIYPDSKSKHEPNGTIQSPFVSLSQAINKTQHEKQVNLYGLNIPFQTITLKQNSTIEQQNMTIQPYFNISRLTFNLSDLHGIVIKNDSHLKIQDAEMLIIPNTIFTDSFNSSKPVKSSCSLEISHSHLEVFFSHGVTLVGFEGCDLSLRYVSFGGNPSYINLNGKSKERQQLILDHVEFNDIKAQSFTQFDIYKSDATFTNSILKNVILNQDSLQRHIPFFFCSDCDLRMENITVTNFTQNFLQNTGKMILKNMTFTNIKLQFLVDFTRKNTSDSTIVEDVSINNITVSQTVFKVKFDLIFKKVTMNKVTYLPVDRQDFFYQKYNGACIFFQQGYVYINQSTFIDINQACIYVFQAELAMKDNMFVTLKPNEPDSPLLAELDQDYHSINLGLVPSADFQNSTDLFIESSIFVKPNHAGAIQQLNNTYLVRIETQNCIFDQVKGSSILIPLNIQEDSFSPQIIVNTTIFNSGGNHIKRENGGAIKADLTKSHIYKSLIYHSIFQGYRVTKLGGAIWLRTGNMTLKSNVFNQNSAQYGGAMSISNIGIVKVNSSNLIINNAARSFGSGILHDAGLKMEQLDHLKTNFDKIGLNGTRKLPVLNWRIKTHNLNSNVNLITPLLRKNESLNEFIIKNTTISSINSTYTIANISDFSINMSIGHSLPQVIELDLIEVSGKIANYIDFNSTKVNITKSKHSKTSLMRSLYVPLIEGRGSMFQINTKETGTGNLTISSNYELFTFFERDFQIKIRINLQNCTQGDILPEGSSICSICPNHTFSLNSPSSPVNSCDKCPDNMICLGGNTIVPSPGFYRFDESSTVALKCINENACLGGINNTLQISPHGFCEEPFRGHLCSSCESGYVPSDNDDSCIKCDNNLIFYLRLAGKIILTTLLVLISVAIKIQASNFLKRDIESGDQDQIRKRRTIIDASSALKLIFTLFQMLTIIKTINFQWVDQLNQAYGYIASIIPFLMNEFSVKCLFMFENLDDKGHINIQVFSRINMQLLLSNSKFINYLSQFYTEKLRFQGSQNSIPRSKYCFLSFYLIYKFISTYFFGKIDFRNLLSLAYLFQICSQISLSFPQRPIEVKVFYLQNLVIILSPLMVLAFIIFIIYLRNLCKRRRRQQQEEEEEEISKFSSESKSATTILFYIYQPSILLHTLNLFKCTDLGQNQYFLQKNLSVQCYETTYYTWGLLMGLPSFCFWGLFLPIYLFRQIYKNMKQAKDDEDEKLKVVIKYSFILSGYKLEYYYWELIIIIRKILMVMAVILIAQNDVVTQGFFVIFILGLSYYIQGNYSTYANNDVGKLDQLSIISMIVMVLLGIYFEGKNINSQLSIPNYMVVYGLSVLGVILVLSCTIKFIVFAFNAYGKYISGLFKNLFKNSKEHNNSSNKNHSGFELDRVQELNGSDSLKRRLNSHHEGD